uniref:NADH dehydrogenase subunit 6 n=1 Tax=Amblyseius obtuserellus TaxID=3061186 RepID=A0AAU6PCK7_9ACAR
MFFLKFFIISWSSMFWLNLFNFHKILILVLNLIFMMFIYSYILKFSWFLMIFIILMIGGLMILFIYFTSMSPSKDLFYFKTHLLYYYILMIMLFNFNKNMNHTSMSTNESTTLNFYMIWNSSIWMLILITYMLIMLLINLELITNLKFSFRIKF